MGWFWAVFGSIFKSCQARFSYFQKSHDERSNMLRPARAGLRIDHRWQIVQNALKTAAFSSNKHRQRPADRSRGVPRHLSAPLRLAASPRCANGCVSGRRVGLVKQAQPANCAARAEGAARRIRSWRGRRYGTSRRSTAGAVSLGACHRASWRGRGRSAASSATVGGSCDASPGCQLQVPPLRWRSRRRAS